jgi:hypothetical protein
LGLANLSTKRQRIAELARTKSGVALSTLHHVIDLEWMREAYRLTRKDGAPGIDGVTAAEYAQNLEANLSDLLERIKSGRYQAPPVRRVYIPKAMEPDLFGPSAFQLSRVDFRCYRPDGKHHPDTDGTTFTFLGFCNAWGKSRKGKNVVRQVKAKKRYARALAAVSDWCRHTDICRSPSSIPNWLHRCGATMPTTA